MLKVNELIESSGGRLIRQGCDTLITGISIDSRTIKPREAFIAIKGDNLDGHEFIREAIKKGASCIVKERNKKIRCNDKRVTFIEVRDTARALGEIARFWRRQFPVPVIAVTGSNGKTTTKEMTAHILSAKLKVLKNEGTKNNHIGVPMTLLELNGTYDVAVIELGANHFGEISYLCGICEPNMGIITNIGPSHLKYFHNLSGVLKEKYAMIDNLDSPRIAILNSDDNILKKKIFSGCARGITLCFGIKNPCEFMASGVRGFNNKTGFCVNKKYKFTLNTPGYYNIYNALAAIAAARIFGMTYRDIRSRLNNFSFPQGRLEVMESKGVRFIDDTYNSNPHSLKQALNTLANFKTKGRKIFIMGDMLELGIREEGFHRQAGREAIRCCDVFITVGSLSRLAAKAAGGPRLKTKAIFTCRNSAQARRVLFNNISPGKDDLVLIKGSRRMKMEEIIRR
ncbi:MAG: UDP-N-acetylmuramoyl-tripeptide--D-alanyl-D-alanine ligase [Candidatus Omnitrophota bacterium]